MSAHKFYLPTDFNGRFLWCNNLREKLAPKKDQYQISDADWALLNTLTDALGHANELIDRTAAFAQSYTSYRLQLWQGPSSRPLSVPADPTLSQPRPPVPANFKSFLLRLVKHIRSHRSYTAADGQAFGFTGPLITVDPATAQPVPRLHLSGGHVHVSYSKHRVFDGVRCYVQRGDAPLALLGLFHRVSFLDPTPFPASPTLWAYQLQYFIGDTDTGLLSNPVSILVSSAISK